MDEPKSSSSGSVAKDISSGNILLMSQLIPYAHFPHFCQLQDVLSVMIREWKLTFPKIVLLIISDHEPLKNWGKYKQQEKFLKGLIKGSNATSMWIFTSGLNIGISKIIGDAIEENYKDRFSEICYRHAEQAKKIFKTPLIGVCRDSLLTYSDTFKEPAKKIALENKGNVLEEQKFNLNPFHSHFLLIQNPAIRKDASGRFLLQMIDALRLHKKPASNVEEDIFPASPVPTIAILVQGSVKSIHYIMSHLERKQPVLVIGGSGGLADVLAYAVYEVGRSLQKIKDKEYVETVLRRGLNDKITKVFPALKDNKMAQNLLCSRVLECIENSEPPEMKHITVLNIMDLTSDMENLPFYLLKVLFKTSKSEALSMQEQLRKDLQLTIDWNCPEIALTKVFYKDTAFKVDNDMFEQALLLDEREPFVSMFLEHGFTVYKYLNASRLIKLYEHSLKETFFGEVCWGKVLGHSKVRKLSPSFLDTELSWIVENLIGVSLIISADELNQNSMDNFNSDCPKDIAIDIATRRAIMALIIWSLLSNRSELAIVLWRHTDKPMITALSASLILDKLIVYVNDTKTREQIADLSKRFAEMAVGVFDLSYKDMPTKAYNALNLRVVEWANNSLIDMASLSQNRSFVAHPCCQKWLTTQYLGNIKIRDLPWGIVTFPVYIKVILCAFFIFPMYLWVRFKETSIHEFVGSEEYEGIDPYELPDDTKTDKKKDATREQSSRSHLMEYHYPPLWQMIFWMWSAPITKFWVSNIFYMVYLIIFSVAVIWPSCGNSYLDSVICIWTSLIAFDSMYSVFAIRKAYPNTPVFGSCMEIIYIISFVIVYFFIRLSDIFVFRDPYSGKVLICCGLLYFYYRMIFIYLPISSTLGPLLYRVKTMITVDFVNYMKLVVFVLIGNGIVMQAILYPDYPLTAELFRMSFHRAFMAFFITPVPELQETVGGNCVEWEQKPQTGAMCRVSNYIDGTCSNGIAFWPYVILFQYVLLLKLILMTVLFALFNATGQKIGSEMDSIWKFQRYKLIVNFSEGLRLPPPLNIFSFFIIVYNFFERCFRGENKLIDKFKGVKGDDESKPEAFMSSADYNYWKHLAREYYSDKERENLEEEYAKKELELISQLTDELNMQNILIHRITAQITQLQVDIYYAHTHLETLKYRTKTKDDTKIVITHSLSRESPYPRTKVQRFPVPDKYVPWEVMWLHYEPKTYTMSKENFPSSLKEYADDDLKKIKDEPSEDSTLKLRYVWNLESTHENGVYRNRKSWITDKNNEPINYRLDLKDLPRNPMGRTGLLGKGALPRWGPNHSVFAVITRWKSKTTGSPSEGGNRLEYVETFQTNRKDLNLPGGFAWSENKYDVIQSYFKMENDSELWSSSDQMIQFFKEHAIGLSEAENEEEHFIGSLVYCGYMDDQMNTDQAWKEVELWHIHYKQSTDLYRKFKYNAKWKELTEDVFTQLPYGQSTLLQNAIRPLNANIEHG